MAASVNNRSKQTIKERNILLSTPIDVNMKSYSDDPVIRKKTERTIATISKIKNLGDLEKVSLNADLTPPTPPSTPQRPQ